MPYNEARLLAIYFEEKAQFTSEQMREARSGGGRGEMVEASIGDDEDDEDWDDDDPLGGMFEDEDNEWQPGIAASTSR